jgi:glycosyltransferase involved in cell wall biosynthesis
MTKQSMPLVSTVIPAYNAAPFLSKAIESALAQSYPLIEIIVVDDGSHDETSEIAQRYPVVLIRHEKNRGVSSARNTGIRAAKGEWVAFLDADDTWHPQKTEIQLSLTHPNYAAVCSAKFDEIDELTFEAVFWRNLGGAPSSTIVRRGVLLELGMFDEELLAVEDYNLWLRFLLAGYRVKLTENWHQYSPPENSLSSNAGKMFLGEVENIKKIARLAELSAEVVHRRIRMLRLEYLPILLHQRRLTLARQQILAMGFRDRASWKFWKAFLPTRVLDLKKKLARGR